MVFKVTWWRCDHLSIILIKHYEHRVWRDHPYDDDDDGDDNHGSNHQEMAQSAA